MGGSRTLTVDDSWAQDRIAEGMAPDLAYSHPDTHVITRWLGGDADSSTPRVTAVEVSEPALLVVCSDGLWNYFEDPDVLGDLVPEGSTPLEVARHLTEAALAAGGRDNITVAVIPLTPMGAGRGTGSGEEESSAMTTFAIECFQNKFLPLGADTMHAVLTVTCIG